MTSPLLEMSADELRSHIGEYVSTDRPRTAGELEAYGPGTEGGSGVLIHVLERQTTCLWLTGVEDFGVVPWVCVDYGYSWAILPGTTVTFRPATANELGHAEEDNPGWARP